MIESQSPDARSGSLYLFDGASYVTLASDDTRSVIVERVEGRDREIEVTYTRRAFFAPVQFATAVAKKQGGGWRVTTREACPSASAAPCR